MYSEQQLVSNVVLCRVMCFGVGKTQEACTAKHNKLLNCSELTDLNLSADLFIRKASIMIASALKISL